jgi:hypothetical protein
MHLAMLHRWSAHWHLGARRSVETGIEERISLKD